jgi:poly(A) polymerase
LLVNTELCDEFLPELSAMRLEQDPIHRHKDVLAHTIAVVENVTRERAGDSFRIVRLAALFHDVGKPKTRSFARGMVSFHHHEVVGARMTRERMQALRYSTEDVDAVTRLVELHLRFHTYQMGWTDSAVRRYVRDAGPLLDELNLLTRCDCTTRNERKAQELSARMDELERRIAELAEKEELAALRPELDGHAVMEHLGLKPGPDVGAALDFLLDLRLDEGLLGVDEATRRLDAWWAQRGRDWRPSLRPRMMSVCGATVGGVVRAGSGSRRWSTSKFARCKPPNKSAIVYPDQ